MTKYTRMTAKQQVEVEGRSIAQQSRQGPVSGVIDYYIRIAPWLLPHYARRPVTMKRFPDGVRGKAFYEKDAPKHTPDRVHTTDVPRAARGTPNAVEPVDYADLRHATDPRFDHALDRFLSQARKRSRDSDRSQGRPYRASLPNGTRPGGRHKDNG